MKAPRLSQASAATATTPYGIEQHCHRFAAWAASRAASVKGCRFTVADGRTILEACGFGADFSQPEQLPAATATDKTHRQWRGKAIKAAKRLGLEVTHGVAAKLINCYLKCRFVCGGCHAHDRVANLHPPVDDILLKSLAACDFGGCANDWRTIRRTRWSKLDSEGYERMIAAIRKCLNGKPLWAIEEHWKGNQ